MAKNELEVAKRFTKMGRSPGRASKGAIDCFSFGGSREHFCEITGAPTSTN